MRALGSALGGVVDVALDRSVVLGFSRIGLVARSRLPGWPADPAPESLRGREIAVTGATSGLGLETALGMARLGARVHLVVRTPAKATPVTARIQREVPTADVVVHRCDVSDLDDVRRFAAAFLEQEPRLDVLVHNAGALPAERTESAQGHELTMATHVLGPVLMTDLLWPALSAHAARVVFVTSGGMYAQRLRPDDPEYLTGDYAGTTAYARSKRAQVELLPLLAERWGAGGIGVWATHPGWADTPGVLDSLPGFHKLMHPVLRDAHGGADTTVWLSAVEPPRESGLWHDRRRRATHFQPGTRSSRGDAERMWDFVVSATGLPAPRRPSGTS